MNIKYFYQEKHDGIVIYLHGGPFFEIKKLTDDPYLKAMYDNGFSIAAINYKTVIGRGGKVDYDEILMTIKELFKDIEIQCIVGDSYGGYLASLVSANVKCKVIVISGFISLAYQRLFSTESKWLTKYMDRNAPDYLANHCIDGQNVTFIQGTGDEQCPYQQFLALKSINKNIKVIFMDEFKHRENGSNIKQVMTCLLSELRSTSVTVN